MAGTLDTTENNLGFARLSLPEGSDSEVLDPANVALFQNFDTMGAALSNAGYSDAQINQMTKNDMVYAIKTIIESGNASSLFPEEEPVT